MPVVLTSSSSAYGLVCVERLKGSLAEVRNEINRLSAPRLPTSPDLADLPALIEREASLIDSLRHAATIPDGCQDEDIVETAAVAAGAIGVWMVVRGAASLLARNFAAIDSTSRVTQAASLVANLDKVLARLNAHLRRDQGLDVDAVFAKAANTVKRHGGLDR